MNTLTPDTDEAIAQAALQDEAVFGVLIDRYDGKLRRYTRRIGVHSSDDYDDVLQEIFIKVYRNLNGFDTSLSFSSWIYRIAHNEAISWYRKRKARPEGHLIESSEEVIAIFESGEDGAEESLNTVIDIDRMNEALSALDQKYREVLVLRFFEYKEYDEISDILKIPIGSVGTLIHRAKKKLKTSLT